MDLDLMALAKVYEDRRAALSEIDRKLDEAMRRIDSQERSGNYDLYEEWHRLHSLWKEWRNAQDAVEDADLTFEEQASKLLPIAEDHPIRVRLRAP